MNDFRFTPAAPEALGISSDAIAAFLRETQECGFPIHSCLLMRHGKMALEHYVAPFTAEKKHRMYSVSKSFTAVAVGMLIREGRLHLSDRVADFFPEYSPAEPVEYTRRATVRDLLRMATPNEDNAYSWDDPDFVKAFFEYRKPKHEPGTVFHYDTAGTTTLCAIVEKITGMKILDYMRPLFDEIGISGDIWCVETPEGRSWTGSGILCTSRDLMRFALLCMNKGVWNGTQWADRQFMEEATSRQIDTSVADSGYIRNGYGYQFWMLPDGGFACCGMGSQFAFVMPRQDTVMITTGDTQGINNADDAIRRAFLRLVDSMKDAPLPPCPEAEERLRRAAESMRIPGPRDLFEPLPARVIRGKKYVFDENLFGFRWMQVDANENGVLLTYDKGDGTQQIPLGLNRWQVFIFPDAYAGKNIAVMDTHYECIGMAAWDSEDTLLGRVYSVDDYLGKINLQLTFKNDTLTVFMTKAAENFFGDYRGYLAGHMQVTEA